MVQLLNSLAEKCSLNRRIRAIKGKYAPNKGN